jgi:integrase
MPLSDTQLRKLGKKDAGKKFADGDGLFAEVLTSGQTSWRYSFRFNGKRPKITYGLYPDVSIVEARKRHRAAKTKLANGINPAAEKKREKAIAKAGATVKQFSVTWLAQHGASKTWRANQIAWLERDIYPAIGNMKLADVTPTDAMALLDAIKARGSDHSALRVRSLGMQIFAHAVGRNIITSNPFKQIAASVIASPRARTRLVAADELRRAFALMEGVRTSAQVRGALRFVLLTLCRLGEATSACWEEINFETATWTIPADRMKMGRAHVVPLAPQAIELLRSLETVAYGSRFVFPSQHKSDRPIFRATVNGVLYEVERRELAAGHQWAHWTPHDLRRTGSTMLNEAGFPSDWIEKQLAHEQKGVRGVYNKAEYLDQRRDMLAQWATMVDSILTNGAVVAFQRRKTAA